MAKFKMKQLALAVGMAVGGAALLPSAQAVNLATDGLGQVLIFPYYTTRAGWNTLINITNTSNQVVALKVRFHEGYNSRDVFDFNVIMSPYDVWNGTVSNTIVDGENVPVFSTSDKTCTTPTIPSGGQTFEGDGANGLLAYTGDAADGGPTTTDRMSEGYIDVIMMGTSPDTGTLASNAVHTSGVPKNCGALNDAFALETYNITELKEQFSSYNVNPLKGAFSLVNSANGWNAAASATTLANFFDPSNSTETVPNLITAQLPPAEAGGYAYSFHEPELTSANTAGQVLLANDTTATSSATSGADAVSYVLARNAVINQWANRVASSASGGWSVASDWVVTFPTKRFYVDGTPSTDSYYSGSNKYRAETDVLPTPTSPFSSSYVKGQSCDKVTFTFYNREEQTPTSSGSPVFSPAPTPAGNQICEEVNVLTFGAGSSATATNVLKSPLGTGTLAANVPTPTAYENGWMQLNFANTAGYLPVTGFAVINRTDPNGTLNESFAIEHAYTRP